MDVKQWEPSEPPLYVAGVQCSIMKVKDDEWLIASTARPRFCLSSESREGAVQTAIRGIKFWQTARINASEIDNRPLTEKQKRHIDKARKRAAARPDGFWDA
jgi:hypothetical protein